MSCAIMPTTHRMGAACGEWTLSWGESDLGSLWRKAVLEMALAERPRSPSHEHSQQLGGEMMSFVQTGDPALPHSAHEGSALGQLDPLSSKVKSGNSSLRDSGWPIFLDKLTRERLVT